MLRARELFHTDCEHLQEREAVDTAIYILNVLRSSTTWGKESQGIEGMRQNGGRAA
jgi:hypothetical protein